MAGHNMRHDKHTKATIERSTEIMRLPTYMTKAKKVIYKSIYREIEWKLSKDRSKLRTATNIYVMLKTLWWLSDRKTNKSTVFTAYIYRHFKFSVIKVKCNKFVVLQATEVKVYANRVIVLSN